MTDRLQEIFDRQLDYVQRLIPNYMRNGTAPYPMHQQRMPWDLNDLHAQEEFRLLAWRMTEEIIEALQSPTPGEFQEEIADTLHFLIELCLASGVSVPELLIGIDGAQVPRDQAVDCLEPLFFMMKSNIIDTAYVSTVPEEWYQVIFSLGRVMHSLRQRPWRLDRRPTDRKIWVAGLHLVWRQFVQACVISGIDHDTLYQAYFAKADINDRRQQQP